MMQALLGGALLGAGLSGMLFLTGRSEGVSGMIRGLWSGERAARLLRACFLGGALLAGALLAMRLPAAFQDAAGRPLAVSALGGLLVGLGAALANGCTSGHGVLGATRFSARSWLAALLFGLSASLTVALYPPADAAPERQSTRSAP